MFLNKAFQRCYRTGVRTKPKIDPVTDIRQPHPASSVFPTQVLLNLAFNRLVLDNLIFDNLVLKNLVLNNIESLRT